MTVVLAVLGAVFVATLWLAASTALSRLRELNGTFGAISATLTEGVQGTSAHVERSLRDLEDLVDRLPHRWEEIQREAKRLDGRARYAVARVKEELDARGLSDERIEELDHELRIVDGDGSEARQLPALPDGVVGVPAAAQPDPNDWQAVALRRKFGI